MPSVPVTPQHAPWRPLMLLVVAALVVRWAWVLAHGSPAPAAGLTFPDEQQYWAVAESLRAGRGLVDEFGYRATFMPGYPAFLAAFVDRPHALLLARLAQATIGALVVIPIFLLAMRLMCTVEGQGPTGTDEDGCGLPLLPQSTIQTPESQVRGPFLAAALAAFDPFLVFGFSHLLLTETIFTTLFAWAILTAWPNHAGARGRFMRAVAAGVLFAACVYVRPSVAAFVFLWCAAAVPLRNRGGSRHPASETAGGGPALHPVAGVAGFEGWGPAALCGLTTCVVFGMCLLPWAERNRRVLGERRWLTTRSGISLYDGLGPRATGASDLAFTKTMPNVRGMTEPQWDAYFSREAWRIAREDSGRVVSLAWAKLRRTWSFVPNEPGSRTPLRMAVSAVWMSGVLAATLVGAVRLRRRRSVWLLLLPAAYFTLLHMVYVGSVRYRVPAMPLLYVIGGAGIATPRPPDRTDRQDD